MQTPILLTLSGAGTVFAKVPNLINQLVAVLPVPDTTVALNVKLYACPAGALVDGNLPSGSVPLGQWTGPAASAGVPLSFSPDGVGLGSYIAAVFADAGVGHGLFLFVK